MTTKCLECNFITGSFLILSFHYKIEHKDKIDVCICGDDLLSGICTDKSYTEITGVASKCSTSGVISRFNFSSNSNSETWAKPHSNSNEERASGLEPLLWVKHNSNCSPTCFFKNTKNRIDVKMKFVIDVEL